MTDLTSGHPGAMHAGQVLMDTVTRRMGKLMMVQDSAGYLAVDHLEALIAYRACLAPLDGGPPWWVLVRSIEPG